MRQLVQPHFFYARQDIISIRQDIIAQSYFVVVNCADPLMSVIYSPVLTLSLIFLQ